MPIKSEKQRRWAHANKDKNPGAARVAAHDQGGKLPKRAPKKKRPA